MKVLVADIETNGLLDELTTIHCLAFKDPTTGQAKSFADQSGHAPIDEGLRELAEADTIVFHNGIKFDVPAIQKVKPWWRPKGVVRDTIVLASLLWPRNPTLMDKDAPLVKRGKLPGNLMGSHSLAAYGYRLGNYKGDYKGGWGTWSPEMHSYMIQDVEVGCDLWLRCQKELETWPPGDYVELEHEVAWIIARQERWGFKFNEEKAVKLLAKLTQRKEEMERDLANVFPPKLVRTPFTPARNNKTKGWTKGVTIFKEQTVPFKPSSRKHVADRLMELGWQPGEFGKDGVPTVDDDILRALPYPEAQQLADLFEVDKRIGQLSTGAQAWLKQVKNGRIHGRVQTVGAVTCRMTHSNPNVAQVPKQSEYRELFEHSLGCLVGCDGDSLEARIEAGYTVPYDGGAYMRTILEGKKEDGTDLHSVNAKALGVSRDVAKTVKYAVTYGAGDWKAGWSAGVQGSREKVARAGKRVKQRLLDASPGLKALSEAVLKAAGRGWIKGIDGRKLVIRKPHAALNTLFQSAGAIVCKRALVIMDKEFQSLGLVPGVDYEFVAAIHDEYQIDARLEHGETIGKIAAAAFTKAGEMLKFRCPTPGNYDVGPNWASTH